MRTRFAVPMLVLFVLGLSFGIFLTADQAGAIIPCKYCICEYHCTPETGPDCPNPNWPYYAYRIGCFPPPGQNCTCKQIEGTFAGCCAFY